MGAAEAGVGEVEGGEGGGGEEGLGVGVAHHVPNRVAPQVQALRPAGGPGPEGGGRGVRRKGVGHGTGRDPRTPCPLGSRAIGRIPPCRREVDTQGELAKR